jgi:four helix bundle protein
MVGVLARGGFVRTPTMKDNRLRFQTLDSYVAAKEIARLVHVAKIRDKELADQAMRASKSCFLQLCEGLPNEGAAMRRRYFTLANGSLHETVGAVDLAVTLGMMSTADADTIQALAVRLKAMLWRLLS